MHPAARAPGQNQFSLAQSGAILAKSRYVTVGTRVWARSSNPIFSTFFTMPIPPKLIPGENERICARRAALRARARAWAKSVLASPAEGHSSQIWVCHRGYPSLTQNFIPNVSFVFHHADSTQTDSW